MSLFSPLAIAPMIDWTYVHFRVLMRILAPCALLYTEMQSTGAILHQPERALFNLPMELPLALQVGGSEIEALVHSAKKAQNHGFSEINLNLGCPSPRVQKGRFGACLMAEKAHVAACIAAMKAAVDRPISAKTRIGIDEQDSYAFFSDFAHALVEAGVDKLIVHARKAWLNGLSPKDNRTIPPLHYEYVYRLKQELPHTPIVINGNIQTLKEIETHLQHVDGVMLGRLACQNPYQIALIHHALYPHVPLISRMEALSKYVAYALALDMPLSLSHVIKPLLNLMHGLPFAKAFRKQLTKIQESGDLSALERINGSQFE